MTQQQAADAVGVSCSLWRAIEAGTREASLTLMLALKGYDAEQGAPMAEPSPADDADQRAIEDALAERLDALEALSIEARLNALEAKMAATQPYRPRLAPDVQALQEDAAMTAARQRKLAELEALEAEEAAGAAGAPTVPIDQPWNTYRPPQLTPAEEAAKKAKAAAAKAAHLATGEPWD